MPRSMKREMARERAQADRSAREPSESPRVKAATEGNAVVVHAERRFNRRGNWVPTMSAQEIAEARTIFQTRFQAAKLKTDAVATKMEGWEAQYQGQWQDDVHVDEEHIFLGKTRERVQTVGSFLHGMTLQVPRLVEFMPAPQSLVGLEEMWRRAKLKEALQAYYFDDIWKVRHTVLPDYIKTFLKFTTGIVKVDYYEDASKPDLRFQVLDRALQYPDPYARRMRDAEWWIDREFWSRASVEDMFRSGHWHRPQDFPDQAPSAAISSTSSQALRRLYGDNLDSAVPVSADELVTVDHYYVGPTRSRAELYGVVVGGESGWLVRYGPSPWAYKGIPMRGGSFDPHEWYIDGTGLVAMRTATQEIIN